MYTVHAAYIGISVSHLLVLAYTAVLLKVTVAVYVFQVLMTLTFDGHI